MHKLYKAAQLVQKDHLSLFLSSSYLFQLFLESFVFPVFLAMTTILFCDSFLFIVCDLVFILTILSPIGSSAIRRRLASSIDLATFLTGTSLNPPSGFLTLAHSLPS